VNIFYQQAIIHSVLETLPISSSWHMNYFLLTNNAAIKLLHLALLPALLSLCLWHKHILKNHSMTLCLAITPTFFIYLIKYLTQTRSFVLPMSLIHFFMGVLLVLIAQRQCHSKKLNPIDDKKLLILMGLLQPLSLLLSGVSRLGITLLPGLVFKLDFNKTILFSFFLEIILIIGETLKQLEQGIVCSLELYGYCSLIFLISLWLVMSLKWRGLAACGYYRIGLGIFLALQ
jgi:undecaprenyl pyrophosphate phosphatase UppP